ncbi:unnamed protein product [Fraxinus pennsylvanica]|uniref:C2H2-type domain-containing protein n=1 Tax=Fraxinus pennsylvanica TaxID=56036 RepID=A0AAD2E6R6_9LAMI|nr:unnamed protein product [Fraxinus pennsylvanica]
MEPEKHRSSDTNSGQESDHRKEKINDDDNSGVERSYECNFCKRGFTNAQALGGHMNIHRKDKGKAKPKKQEGSSIQNKYNNEDFLDSRFFPPVPSSDRNNFTAVRNYQVYLPSSNSTLSSRDDLHQNNLPQENIIFFDDHKDENFSLRIGPPPRRDGKNENVIAKENEIDLELRLGHGHDP